MHEIHGTIRKDLKPVSAEYSIENAFGTTLFSGSFEPAESWTISDIGFVIGLNKISVSVAFADGTTTELTEWIGNFKRHGKMPHSVMTLLAHFVTSASCVTMMTVFPLS